MSKIDKIKEYAEILSKKRKLYANDCPYFTSADYWKIETEVIIGKKILEILNEEESV